MYVPFQVTPTRLEFAAYPGDRVSGSISFWNGTDAFLPVHVEGADFAPQGEEGHVFVDGEAAAANSIKNWVVPAIPDVNVAPKEKITLDFAIDVPANASPGMRWGRLWLRLLPLDKAAA